MRTIIATVLLSLYSIPAMAQSTDEPKELKDPATVVTPPATNLHDVEVVWPRETPILKERKIIPESAVVPPNQNYQAACQEGDVKRCSGVDLSTFESTIRVQKSDKMLPRLMKPVVHIRLVAEADERRPSPRKRHFKRH